MRRIKVLTALVLANLSIILFASAAEVYVPAKPGEVMPLEQAREKSTIAKFRDWVVQDRALYRAGEFQLDVFGAASARDLDTLGDHYAGYGLGLNYFPSRNFGVGFQTRDVLEEGEAFANRVAFNTFLRFPLENLSLYGLLQVGYRLQRPDLDFRFGVGGGAEYRFTPTFGAFADVVLETEEFDGFTDHVARFGFRFSM